MSCTTCGSNVPCGCNCGPNLTQDPATCCNQPRTSGCCQNVVAPVPTPFYNCAPACPESHVQKITIQSFSADVKILDSWNVPACDASAVVNAQSLHAIVVGSYLWNPTYGYFQITAFNSGTGQITLLNNCNEGNAAAGTNIPACTEFTVTVPPCDCASSTGVCVAIDFTAPDVGDCIDITLTSTQGIQTSFVVQIGTGQYRVSAVKPNDIITICNDGDGITPGTSVIAQNAQGDYQYCLQILSSNPCDADAQDSGIVLICGDNSQTVPLSGATKGYVLTLIDELTETGAYRPLGATDCTTLSAILNISAGISTYNNVLVSSTTQFLAGDLIEIGGATQTYTIDLVVDPTHLNITATDVPALPYAYPSGSLVCPANCCEAVQHIIETELACDSQAHRFAIDDTVFSKDISTLVGDSVDNVIEVVLTDNLIAPLTLPDDCPDALYNVSAIVNVGILCDYDSAIDPAMIAHEVQIYWSNNNGLGRFCVTDYSWDGYNSGLAYPPDGALNPIWQHLFIAAGSYPMMFHVGYIVSDTLANPGDLITLKANYKATVGDNNWPDNPRTTAFYMGGAYVITRVQ